MRLFDDRMYNSLHAFTKIGYSNPFLPERIELERKALGRLFKGSGKVWSKQLHFDEAQANTETFEKAVRPLLEGLRIEVFKHRRIIKKDLEVYEEIILFYLFYAFRANLQKMIYEKTALGPSNLSPIYKRFKGTADYFLETDKYDFKLKYQIPHVFSCFFQVIRAFYFIFEYLVGGSKPLTKLRSEIWQSIFTHNRKRYFSGIYEKMQTIPTLITGHSGTGKELVAQAIAFSSYIPFDPERNIFTQDYRESLFTLNLSTLSPTLIESELFGHRKGAFTGALDEHNGFFESCGPAGSVFLDEIGEIDTQTQVKLLNLLQTRQFRKVGETDQKYFEGKILAATNRDLNLEIEKGNFREDFFYRLCADQIKTPTLFEQIQDAPDDLVNLVGFLANKLGGEENGKALAKETMEHIETKLPKRYPWPGNIRELEQCIRSIMVNGEYLPPRKGKDDKGLLAMINKGDLTAKELLRAYASSIYEECGSYSETARRMEVDYRTIKTYVTTEK